MNNSKNMSFNKKHKHLTYKDRSIIQEFLTYGHSFTTIGKRIHKDRTTIAKEVKHHRFVRYCSGRRTVVCNKLSKAPYVCNGCNLLVTCKQPKYLYDAAVADHEYRSTLSSTRSRLRLTKSQIADINEVISPLMIHKHHSVNHVYVSHPELLPFSKSTFYRYVDLGLFNVKNIDLPRKVRFKIKKEYDYSRKKIDTRYRLGRQYHDFQDYIEWDPQASVVEMDTVIGTPGGKGGQVLSYSSFPQL